LESWSGKGIACLECFKKNLIFVQNNKSGEVLYMKYAGFYVKQILDSCDEDFKG
jgi:hypothetical protein